MTDATTCLRVAGDGESWPGFTTVDGRPDALAAAGYRLPAADAGASAIYLDHVLERLDAPDGARLLRDCRRALARGGRIRIVTEDLGRILEQHASPQAWVAGGWYENGYDWALMRSRMLNRAFREPGGRWLYDLTEIVRIGTLVGLRDAQRCRPGDSADPRLAGHEPPSEVDLIVELAKPTRPETEQPLVSVLVPLYRTTYLRQTVASVLEQTYDNFELVLCDDGPPGGAEPILRSFSSHPRFERIRYFHNAQRQGDARNYVACFGKARGAYIKYLNDDDLLAPRCLEVMTACLRAHPDVTLVTSHRQIIDPDGRVLPELNFSERPVGRSAVISGASAIGRMLARKINFVGEPTTVMFRRADADGFTPNFWSLAGLNFAGNGDVTLWMNLLAQGDLIYLTESLSSFRHHPGQTSHDGEVIRLAHIAWKRAAEGAAEVGLHVAGATPQLEVRPLDVIPWWPPAWHERFDQARDRLQGARAAGAAATDFADLLTVLLPPPGSPASQDAELMVRLAELRFASGDVRGALDLAVTVTRAMPHHQPAHLLVARLLQAMGDAANAQSIFKETQGIYPLFRHDGGVTKGDDGVVSLAPEARFRIEADLPDALFTIRLLAHTTAGFRNLPLRFTARVGGGATAASAVYHGELTRDGESLILELPIPHQASPVEIALSWRGSPERFLPPLVAPLSVQITGLDLSLASRPAGGDPEVAGR